MLKREITYEDFNGNKQTDVFYFNISKPDLIDLEVEYEDGFGAMIEKIVETKDRKTLIKIFKEIVLLAYGQKSEDGKRFVKSDELRVEFSQTAAYSVLFVELATDDDAAATFLKGVLPKDIAAEFDKALPPTPSVSTVIPTTPTTTTPSPS